MFKMPGVPKEFHTLTVIVGLGLVLMGLYFEKAYYEYGGLALTLIGLVVSWYRWYAKEKESEDLDSLFKFDEVKKTEDNKAEENKAEGNSTEIMTEEKKI